MFSTILKEVTAYFDKRALISSFFPNLLFWGITSAAILLQLKGWQSSLNAWKELDAILQILLMVAFIAWVSFWSVLLLNFQSYLLILYEGDWPTKRLFNWRRTEWQARWREWDSLDSQLETSENTLLQEATEYEILQQRLSSVTTFSVPAAQIPELTTFVTNQKTQVGQLKQFFDKSEDKRDEPTFTGALLSVGKDIRDKWGAVSTSQNDEETNEALKKLIDEMNVITADLVTIVQKRQKEVEAKRLRLNQNFLLYFPPYQHDVMPTKLGNVLRAAEGHVWLRYQLDPVQIWSRLQSLLPKEFAEPFQDSKASLDLLITISSYSLLFGLPLSAWLAFNSPRQFLWWIPFLLLGVAIATRVKLLIAAALISIAFVGFGLLNLNPNWVKFWEPLQTVSVCYFGILAIAWVSYQNAVQAALNYAEKLGSAFDLYRWKVLEELHLQLPPNIEEERELWKQVSALLYRGSLPAPAGYFSYVKDEKKTKEPISAVSPSTLVPVPAYTLPPYRVVVEGDLTEQLLPNSEILVDVARRKEDVVDKIPLTSLDPNKPISLTTMQPPADLQKRFIVGVELSAGNTQGGTLKPGDKVNVNIVQTDAVTQTPKTTEFKDVMIVELYQKPVSSTPNVVVKDIVVIAVQQADHESFMTNITTGTVIIVRNIA